MSTDTSGHYINARYRLRLDCDISQILTVCEDLSTWVVIGFEGGTNEVHPHCHLVCPGHPGTKHKHSDLRKTLDNMFKPFLVNTRSNKYMKLCRSLVASLKYAVKHGHFKVINPGQLQAQGIDIESLHKQSYLKNSGDTRIAKELEEIENLYYRDEFTYGQFGRAFVQIRLHYGFTVSPTIVRSYLTKHYLKKNPDKISQYIAQECKVFGFPGSDNYRFLG